jgi:hypothetical protein
MVMIKPFSKGFLHPLDLSDILKSSCILFEEDGMIMHAWACALRGGDFRMTGEKEFPVEFRRGLGRESGRGTGSPSRPFICTRDFSGD